MIAGPIRTRLATPADAAGIATIYNEGIADRIATFETEPRTPEQITALLTDKGDRFPTIVAERDGRVVAWAGAGPYRNRPAYVGVAEHSVYVSPDSAGRGVGRALLGAYVASTEAAGIWTLQAGLFPENAASLALHAGAGFRVVGRRERIGRMRGSWRDVVLVERRSTLA